VPLAAVHVVDKPATHNVTVTRTKWSSSDSADAARAGRDALADGRYDEAIRRLRDAIQSDPGNATAQYNLACAYARRGDRDMALTMLRDSVYSGYVDSEHMLADDDLASIRGPEMEALAELQQHLVLTDADGGWSAAAQRYEVFARKHPDIPRAWFNLGFALLSARDDRRAILIFTKTLEEGYQPGKSMYNIACAYAHLNDRATALDWLHRSDAAGFDVGARAASDPDLAALASDPWLAAISKSPKEKSH
jgi:tetratricopeptide (TPR) repeat protein